MRAGVTRPVVVVSALAKVTDALLALAPQVNLERVPAVDAAVLALVPRHAETARELPGTETALEHDSRSMPRRSAAS